MPPLADYPGLAEPAFCHIPDYAYTLGPEVGELCSMVGFTPDAEQQLLLDAAFGFRPDGKRAAFDLGLVVSRQNMKTGWCKMLALGWLFVTDERLVIWSAHEYSTAQESFRDLCELVEGTDALASRVKITRGNGDEGIETHDGRCRIKFKARTKTGGRGLSGDKIILDEAFALQPEHMGALLPTLSARPDPQIIYASSAGLEQSAVLRAIRDRGRKGSDPRLAYVEWTDDLPGECRQKDACTHKFGQVTGCRLDDERRWFRANPQLGKRIALEFVQSERRAMPPAEFGRERLGWWDEDPNAGGVFPPGRWEACADGPDAEKAYAGSQIDGTPVWALDVSIDRKRSSIGVCGARFDGIPHLELVETAPETDWIVPFLTEKTRKWGGSVVIDPASPANTLTDDLVKAGVKVHKVTARDYAAACGWLYDAVKNKEIRHLGQEELDVSVRDAVLRDLAGGFAWDRKKPLSDITPLVAVTLACWGHRTYGGDIAGSVW